jgi:hypothetical protein
MLNQLPNKNTSAQSAIVCLTRGYPDVNGYKKLIRRNRSVYETINRNRIRQYPLIIWHQGNIPPAHQRFVLAQEANRDVRFVDVSGAFQLPQGIDPSELMESWSVGYRLMCRFHFYHIWQCTQQFDFVMRIDEDCTLRCVVADPIQWLMKHRLDFAAAAFEAESHELTNQTLAPFVNRYAGSIAPQSHCAEPYNHVFPYTNLYVTRTGFWRHPEVQRFLTAVAFERDSIRLRWGDLPVLGAALNMFARAGAIALIPHFAYRHGSHHVTVSTVPLELIGH